MKLVQRHLFKGTREFEFVDDHVKFRSKAPFKEAEELTVMLTVLNPEPVITRSSLDFTSRVNGETLLSFYLAKPNAQEFTAFVSALRAKALDEYQRFAGLKPSPASTTLAGNVDDEPPAFDEPPLPARLGKTLDVARIDEAIQMLKTYLNDDDVLALITALETLQGDPQNESRQIDVINAFNDLGPSQGAVLTYAPYVGILLSDGPAGSPY